MIFMVDFENTNGAGLEGIDLLTENDTVVVFYSNVVDHVKNKYLEKLFSCSADIKLRKLVNCGANALDNYIISEIGYIIGSGTKDLIAIISNDKGFTYAKDYWGHVAEKKTRIVIASDMEQAFKSAGTQDARSKIIQKYEEKKSITDEFEKFKSAKELETKIKDKLTNKAEYKKITVMYKMSKSKRDLYLNMLKTYGKDGLQMYNEIKSIDHK